MTSKLDDDLKMITIPSYLNPAAPESEDLVLVFTIGELERARRRGEIMMRHHEAKGVNADDLIRCGLKVS
jgi:hypothetical protein